MPDFKWARFDDPASKTGGIELVSNTPVKEIYAWVGDTRNDFRRDYRLVGLPDNHLGYWEKPEYPIEPPGYPDKAPVGSDTSKYRVKDKDDGRLKLSKEINCDVIVSEFCKFRLNESVFLNQTLEQLVYAQKNFNPDWQTPKWGDVQVQKNFWRRVMATQVSTNRWRIEFTEASNAYRAFFFQVAFAVSLFTSLLTYAY